MEHLKAIVSGDKIYTFIFDRHSELLKSIPTFLLDSYHSYCYWHLKLNLTAAISIKERRRPFILKKFKKLVYAPIHKEFQTEYENLVNLENQQANKFLASVPLEHWANAYFPGQRYGCVSSIIAESFNSWILEQRQLPITSMLDSIWRRLMMKFTENKEMFRRRNSVLCLIFEKKLTANMESSKTMKLIRTSDVVFEMLSLDGNFFVDLSWLSCSYNL